MEQDEEEEMKKEQEQEQEEHENIGKWRTGTILGSPLRVRIWGRVQSRTS